MGMLNSPGDPGREARAQMAQHEKAAAPKPEPMIGKDGKPLPKRYKLYDKIASKATVGMMNVIIAAVSALLIIALIIGVVTGNPQ